MRGRHWAEMSINLKKHRLVVLNTVLSSISYTFCNEVFLRTRIPVHILEPIFGDLLQVYVIEMIENLFHLASSNSKYRV